jgi:hypothetical protein
MPEIQGSLILDTRYCNLTEFSLAESKGSLNLTECALAERDRCSKHTANPYRSLAGPAGMTDRVQT